MSSALEGRARLRSAAGGLVLLAGLAGLCGLAVIVAVSPVAGPPLALASLVAALVVRNRSLAASIVLVVGGAVCLLVSVVLVSVWPVAVAAVAPVLVVSAVAAARRATLARVGVRVARVVAALVAVVAVALVISAWPVTLTLVALVAGTWVLAFRSPLLGLGAAMLAFGAEGLIKAQLGAEPTPLPFGEKAVGAASIDLALLGVLAAIAWRHGHTRLGEIWERMTRGERVATTLVLAWLALSVIQIVQGGEPGRGLAGFRLFQAYVVITLAVVIALHPWRSSDRFVRIVLLVALAVATYAALRVVTGPSAAETEHALGENTTTTYGGSVRAFGSFSGAVGLGSYLAPLAVFALVVGTLSPRYRRLGLLVGALSVVAVVASFGRAPLVGIAAGVAFATATLLGGGRRRVMRVAASAGIVGIIVSAGVLLAAATASQEVADRARGLFDPLDDRSVQLRLENWRESAEQALDQPLGQGLGAVGGASGSNRESLVTTDNSFLKVLVEQGVGGAVLFVGGFLALVFILHRRLRRRSNGSAVVGAAALGGFVSFLVMAASGETVEQPGKVIAWALLGLTVVEALSEGRPELPCA